MCFRHDRRTGRIGSVSNQRTDEKVRTRTSVISNRSMASRTRLITPSTPHSPSLPSSPSSSPTPKFRGYTPPPKPKPRIRDANSTSATVNSKAKKHAAGKAEKGYVKRADGVLRLAHAIPMSPGCFHESIVSWNEAARLCARDRRALAKSFQFSPSPLPLSLSLSRSLTSWVHACAEHMFPLYPNPLQIKFM